jgi:hypothetical protein
MKLARAFNAASNAPDTLVMRRSAALNDKRGAASHAGLGSRAPSGARRAGYVLRGGALTTLVRVGSHQVHNDLTWSNRYCP